MYFKIGESDKERFAFYTVWVVFWRYFGALFVAYKRERLPKRWVT